MPDRSLASEESCLETDELRRQQVKEFARELRAFHARMGAPSYRTLSYRSGDWLTPPTLSRAFSGRSCPRWEVVERILMACGAAADEIPEWRGRWAPVWVLWKRNDNAAAGAIAVSRTVGMEIVAPATLSEAAHLPASAETYPPASAMHQGHECADCGAWVVNEERHLAWHWKLERRATPEGGPTTLRAVSPGRGLLGRRKQQL